MYFERTHDYALVKRIVTHPKIWPNVIDDFAPSAEAYQPAQAEGIWYVLAQDGDEVLGVIAFIERSPIIFEIHPVLLPECWYSLRQKPAVLGAMDWIWQNTRAQSIIGAVPVLAHRTKLRLPPKLGMTQYGVHPKSFLKNGKLVDQVLFAVSRPGL